jgi:excisionase family DNA binding protein
MIAQNEQNPSEGNPKFLTVQQVAEMLSVSCSTVRIWVDEGQLKALRYRRAIRIKFSDLDAFVEKFMTKPN